MRTRWRQSDHRQGARPLRHDRGPRLPLGVLVHPLWVDVRDFTAREVWQEYGFLSNVSLTLGLVGRLGCSGLSDCCSLAVYPQESWPASLCAGGLWETLAPGVRSRSVEPIWRAWRSWAADAGVRHGVDKIGRLVDLWDELRRSRRHGRATLGPGGCRARRGACSVVVVERAEVRTRTRAQRCARGRRRTNTSPTSS
jgi:hypothetical protein